MARKNAPGSASQPPSLLSEVAIKLLERQKEKAEELLRAEPLPLEEIQPWRAMTTDVLIKGLGSDSAWNFIGVLNNWQTHTYDFDGDEKEIEDTQNGLKRSIRMLAGCIELLVQTSLGAREKATVKVRPAGVLSAGSREGIILKTTFGRYTTGVLIGEGGAGRVFEATDEASQVYAIKLLDPLKTTSDKRKRFKNEIIFGIKNDHTNIIRILDHGLYNDEKGEAPFYVMPLYKGTLRKLLNSGIAREKALPFFAQLLDGVEAAHLQGTVHRDLKPENVLYDPASDRLVVADFGIAQFNQEELYTLVETRACDRLANFQYAAPEQRQRGQPVDHCADIYALGLILNELFTGEIPQGSGHKIIASVAPEYAYLDELVEQMRRQSHAERPASIGQIKQKLIARRNDFVSQQRLSSLRKTVVPESELDDPLILDPIRLVGADYDRRGQLILQLSQPINDGWAHALRNFGSHTSVLGKGPESFSLRGPTASIPARENDVQDIINYFKEWLPRVNQRYKEMVISEKKRLEEESRQKLLAEIAEEERLQRIRSKIQI